MFTKQDFKILFENWEWVIDVETEGLSRQDLLIQPQPGGNCMMWVLGHIVESMKDMVLTLGGSVPEDYKVYARFERNSEPVLADEPGLPGLEQMKTDFSALSKLAEEALDAQDLAFFAQPGWIETNGATILFLAFHLSYHAGQLEFLRNLAGRTEKVI